MPESSAASSRGYRPGTCDERRGRFAVIVSRARILLASSTVDGLSLQGRPVRRSPRRGRLSRHASVYVTDRADSRLSSPEFVGGAETEREEHVRILTFCFLFSPRLHSARPRVW